VIPDRKQFQVLYSVVGAHSVAVVYHFIGLQNPTNVVRHD
jgi:hypothetical protein